MSRIRFKWRKQITRGQLLLKSSIPALMLLPALLLAILIISGDSRLQLNEMLYRNSTEVKHLPASDIYEPMINSFKLSSFWVRSGAITRIGNPDIFTQEMERLIADIPLIEGMSIRDGEGREVEAYKDGENGIKVRTVTEEDSASLSQRRREAGIDSMILRSPGSTEGLGDLNVIRLSRPYILPEREEMGITLSMKLYGDDDNYLRLWLDLSLKHLAMMVNDGKLSDDSVIYILLNDDEYVSYRISDFLSSGNSTAYSEEDEALNSEVIEAISSYRKNREIPDNDIARIHAADTDWWTQFSTMEFEESSLVIGSYTPENSLLVSRLRNPALILGFILLIVAGFYFFFLISDYRTALHRYLTESEEDKVRRMIKLGENLYCEFKSSLRWDYREEKGNRALEQVIMKSVSAFSNSDGGTLLIGVRDDGTVLGLENDYGCLKEGGTDFYELHLRTLLSNMFGVAYPVSHIKIDFPVLEGIEICRVQIRKGDEPLFLIANEKGSGKTEKFFVRSGNSSRQIASLSEMTEYILNRFD